MEFSLKTRAGITLIGDVYEPETDTEKIILLVHGLGDHFGRFSDWSQRYVEKGIAVVGVDLPGHGRSPGRRGHINSYQEYNSIIESLAQYAITRFGNLPIGLYGHSLGGNIILNYLLTNTFGFEFAIVTSPWIKLVSSPSRALVVIAKLINKIFPGLQQANGLQLEHISRAEDVTAKYNNDPLVHDRVSVRLGLEAMNAADRILDAGGVIDVPMLLLHGTDDMITSTEGSSQFAEINTNVTLKLWENGYHELQNEPFNAEVFDFIYNWLKQLK